MRESIKFSPQFARRRRGIPFRSSSLGFAGGHIKLPFFEILPVFFEPLKTAFVLIPENKKTISSLKEKI